MRFNRYYKTRVLLVRHNWHESTKKAFLHDYYHGDFDLFWLSCHGQFDHYRPQNSYIVLNGDNRNGIPEQTIGYEEFNVNSDKPSARRLLVLNACDGATTTLNNSPSAIGFGSKMVNQYQALISHQWSIYDGAGLVHGILLAGHLAEGSSYFDSFALTLSDFIAGKEHVLSKIKTWLPESKVAETVENNSGVDYTNIFYYGSLSFLQ
jgi:hypothetical protein